MDEWNEGFVHPFSTPGSYYLYDVNTNYILKVTKNIHDSFKNLGTEKPNLDAYDAMLLNRFQSNGFLRKNPLREIEHPMTAILPSILDRRVQNITLQVTQQCNLRCKYCVYSGGYTTRTHSSLTMTAETARKGVDFLIGHSADLPSVNVSFYGGEPLLEFPLIRKTVEHALASGQGKDITFAMTTNGTLLNDEIMRFLQNHRFSILISMDGPREIHDQNRVFANGKGTFDTLMANVRLARDRYPELYARISFNAVVDPRLDMTCSSNFFVNCEELRQSPVSSNVIGSDYRKQRRDIPELFLIQDETEYFKVLLNRIGRIGDERVSKIAEGRFVQMWGGMHLGRDKTSAFPSKAHPSGPCIPGARKLFMDVQGNFFPCESTSEASRCMRIGSVDSGFDVPQIAKLLNVGKITEEECKSCWGFRLCRQCCMAADGLDDLSRKKRLAMCGKMLRANENNMKDYCTLVEYGYIFDRDDSIMVSYEVGI